MTDLRFDAPDVVDALEAMTLEDTDDLDFGLVVMDRHGTVVWYNAHEAEHTGFVPAEVMGKRFFETVGPCMNNYLVAQRYESSDELDETLDYVFTVKMEPTPVTLRLLARSGSARQYLAVEFA